MWKNKWMNIKNSNTQINKHKNLRQKSDRRIKMRKMRNWIDIWGYMYQKVVYRINMNILNNIKYIKYFNKIFEIIY